MKNFLTILTITLLIVILEVERLGYYHEFDENPMTKEDIDKILDTAFKFREVLDRPIKKVPSLKGKNILNLFTIRCFYFHQIHKLKVNTRQINTI